MSLQALLIVAAGMLPGGNPPGNVIISNFQIVDYAKVEIQGSLRSAERRPGERVTVEVERRGMKKTSFPLDLSEVKGWTDERLKRHDGRLVRVTGTLVQKTLTPGKGDPANQFILRAETLELRETDHSLPAGKSARLADAQFAKAEIQGDLVTVEMRGTAPFWLESGIRFALDSSKLKEWTEQKLSSYCNGRYVRVTGTLETRHFKIWPSRRGGADGSDEDRITVVAETIKFLEPDFVPPKGPGPARTLRK